MKRHGYRWRANAKWDCSQPNFFRTRLYLGTFHLASSPMFHRIRCSFRFYSHISEKSSSVSLFLFFFLLNNFCLGHTNFSLPNKNSDSWLHCTESTGSNGLNLSQLTSTLLYELLECALIYQFALDFLALLTITNATTQLQLLSTPFALFIYHMAHFP